MSDLPTEVEASFKDGCLYVSLPDYGRLGPLSVIDVTVLHAVTGWVVTTYGLPTVTNIGVERKEAG